MPRPSGSRGPSSAPGRAGPPSPPDRGPRPPAPPRERWPGSPPELFGQPVRAPQVSGVEPMDPSSWLRQRSEPRAEQVDGLHSGVLAHHGVEALLDPPPTVLALEPKPVRDGQSVGDQVNR